MAFITNQNKDGATTLAKRLSELVSHADTLDMVEALKAYRPKGLELSKSTIGDAVIAIQVLGKFKGALTVSLRKFAMDVGDDIRNDYLSLVKRRLDAESIVVTIEKR